mgnify:FL=1
MVGKADALVKSSAAMDLLADVVTVCEAGPGTVSLNFQVNDSEEWVEVEIEPWAKDAQVANGLEALEDEASVWLREWLGRYRKALAATVRESLEGE